MFTVRGGGDNGDDTQTRANLAPPHYESAITPDRWQVLVANKETYSTAISFVHGQRARNVSV
jgi:hypothetical protein